jgi:hypothetical protein
MHAYDREKSFIYIQRWRQQRREGGDYGKEWPWSGPRSAAGNLTGPSLEVNVCMRMPIG